jgi:hypothetical protein
MLEVEFSEYYPLTKEQIDAYVPLQPGFYLLAVHLVSGNHKIFLTVQSKNLRHSLRRIMKKDFSQLPDIAEQCINKYKCYFNYFVITNNNYIEDIRKMVSELTDFDQGHFMTNTN